MLIYYFPIAVFLIVGLFLIRTQTLHHVMLIALNGLQWTLTIYECFNYNNVELGYFTVDATALIMLIVLSILTTTSSYHSIYYLAHHHKHHDNPLRAQAIYYSALGLLIVAQTGAFLANHIAVTWIFIEFTTFSAAILIYHERQEDAVEATWKYLFICSVALTLAFTGILFLSISAQEVGTLNLAYSSLINHAMMFNPSWLKISFLLILVGYSAKMGLFPMHTVTVDAHSVAPPPISAFISTTLMNVGFVAIYRTYSVVVSTSIAEWANHILLLVGATSVFVAVVYLVQVRHFKRMLAYSSLENMGLVAIALSLGGIGYYAAFLHLIFHSFIKASMFYQIQQVHVIFKTYIIKNTGDYFKSNLTGSVAVLLIFICIAAIPPSGLFISEFMIFSALFIDHRWGILAFLLILLSFAVWALGKNFLHLLFAPLQEFETEIIETCPRRQTISQYLLIGLVIYLGLFPPPQMVYLINEAISILPH